MNNSTIADAGAAIAQAAALLQRGRLPEAEAACRAILGSAPNHPEALYCFGLVHAQTGRLAEAGRLIAHSLKINPRSPAAHSDLGNVLSGLGQHEHAIESFNEAIGQKPDHVAAFLGRGNAFMGLSRFAEAVASYDRAIAIKPDLADAHANRGAALMSLGRFDAAIASFDRVVALKPFNFVAIGYRAEALRLLRRHEEAIASCDRALALKPDLAGAWLVRGKSLQALKRREESLAAFQKAAALQPDLIEAWCGCGIVSAELKRLGDAVAAYDKVLGIGDMAYVQGLRLHAKMHACDWTGFDADCAKLLSSLREGSRVSPPFAVLPIDSTSADQLQCAELFIAHTAPAAAEPLWRGEIYSHDRIRVAYLSSDLHEHAIARLFVGLFEHHDRSMFETTALSYCPPQDGEMHRRVRQSFDHFIDAGSWTDRQIAERMRAMEIDIAVDLNGHTDNARTGVLAMRAAPIQVSHVGFPGTMGAGFIDYILGDRVVIPEDQRQFYTERVVYLPDSYFPNDSKRRIADWVPTRAEVGLPGQGFVFCSFNNNYKITPAVFDIWMRLLREVDGSSLWLLEGNSVAPQNLRRQAEMRGVSPDRLIFAPRLLPEQHLARHRAADLFLDTLHYNAHTTACDALWAGLPVVTRLGSTFAGRVGASLLQAVGMPELITPSIEGYEALALRLARDPAALALLKAKLGRQIASCPLFDTARITRHIEKAYVSMVERYRAGDPPAGFAVSPSETDG